MTETEAFDVARALRSQTNKPVPGFEDRAGDVMDAYRAVAHGDHWIFTPNVAGLDRDEMLAVQYPYYVVSPDGRCVRVPHADGLEAAEALCQNID